MGLKKQGAGRVGEGWGGKRMRAILERIDRTDFSSPSVLADKQLQELFSTRKYNEHKATVRQTGTFLSVCFIA